MKRRKSYRSLHQFHNDLLEAAEEKVVHRNHYLIFTQRGKQYIRYGLYDGQITENIVTKEEIHEED